MERYSFFGTCANDSFHTKKVLKNIVSQTISPEEVILVDSGDANNFKDYKVFFKSKNINFIYLFEKLPRVEALNRAIDNISTDFCFRFDTRTRFDSNYAKESLKLLNDQNLNSPFVGGVPGTIPENSSCSAKICSEIFSRSYVFFYPRHRQRGFSGQASSIYLGGFKSDILKKIKYRNNAYLISEDSLLASDFKSHDYKLWIDSSIKLKYVSRASIFNNLRLFNTYGFCRFNTIFISRKVHSLRRYLLVFFTFILYFLFTYKFFPLTILLFPLMLLIINIYGEIILKKRKKYIILPLIASFFQISWIIGFLWGIFNCYKMRKLTTNFIK